jgi:uncharacterized protein YkwD
MPLLNAHRLPALAVAVASGLVLALPGAASAASAAAADPALCGDKSLAPSPSNVQRIEHATLCLLNQERVTRGRHRLKSNDTLAGIATSYTRQMVKGTFFDHVSPSGSTMLGRVKATSYLRNTRSWSLGENLAWGTGVLATPAQTVNAWMHSAGHKRNILDKSFREIGVGITVGAPVALSAAQAGATYATEFGRRG